MGSIRIAHTSQSTAGMTKSNMKSSWRDHGEPHRPLGAARGTHENLHPLMVSPEATVEQDETSHPSFLLAPSLITSYSLSFQLSPSQLFKKKKVNSLPVLLKPNMSVIDEGIFYNFKGEKLSE